MALKNIKPDGTAMSPEAYKLNELTITNKDGHVIDIQYAVQEIILTESIYSPTVICTVNLKDESDMIEVLPLYGMEALYVDISRTMGEGGSEQEFKGTFYVTDYPLYGRSSEREHVQVWGVTGVNKGVWTNSLKKISRSYEGCLLNEITSIAKKSLNLKVNENGSSPVQGKGIINIQSPLHAIDWFRRRLLDCCGTPFYLYQTLQNDEDEIELCSHQNMAKGSVYNSQPFTDTKLFSYEAGTSEDFNQRRHTILNISSQLKLSKFTPIRSGAWGSHTKWVDIGNKSWGKTIYKYDDDFPIDKTIFKSNLFDEPKNEEASGGGGGGGSSGSPTKKKNESEVGDEFYSNINTLSRNSGAYEGDLGNYIESTYEKTGIAKAWPGVFNTLQHEITVHGDLELNAGKIVDISFPKAADPLLVGTGEDVFLSGKYIVTSCVHTFKDSVYTTEMRVKRDSFVK